VKEHALHRSEQVSQRNDTLRGFFLDAFPCPAGGASASPLILAPNQLRGNPR